MLENIFYNKKSVILYLAFAVVITLTPFCDFVGTEKELLCYIAIGICLIANVECGIACLLFALPFVAVTAVPLAGINIHLIQILEMVVIFKVTATKWFDLNIETMFKILIVCFFTQAVPLIFCSQDFSSVVKLTLNILLFYTIYIEITNCYIGTKTLYISFGLGIIVACIAGFYYISPETDMSYLMYDNRIRYTGLWTDPNFMSMFCMLAVSIFLNIDTKSLKKIIIVSPLIVFPAYVGTLTLSRSFFVVGIIVVFIYVLSTIKHFNFRTISIILISAITVFYLLEYAEHLVEVRHYTERGLTNGRVDRSFLVLHVFRQSLTTIFFGFGFDNMEYMAELRFNITESHNSYVDILTQFGGVFTLILIIIILKFKNWHRLIIRELLKPSGQLLLIIMLYGGSLSLLKYEFTYIIGALFFSKIVLENTYNKQEGI